MTKITVDVSELRNKLTQIYNEAYDASVSNNDNKRRDGLLVLVAKLRDLKAELENITTELK